MIHSIPLSRRRVLLRGPDCRVWYLGEKVYNWGQGARVRRPPFTPPREIFWGHLLEADELDRVVEGEDAEEFCERKKSCYMDFARTCLLQRVPLLGSTSQVMISFSTWFCTSTFKYQLSDFIYFSQAPLRAPPVRHKPTTQERPSQPARTVPHHEGTSARPPPAIDVASSNSGSQVVAGMLAAPSDLMVWCWLPQGSCHVNLWPLTWLSSLSSSQRPLLM